jgi:Bifunctional DNA primase/polymerase, N-terminal
MRAIASGEHAACRGVNKRQAVNAALAWARQGWAVLPCREDKSPYTEHGVSDATRHPQVIRRWWAGWPGALVGGRTDGLAVLDLDSYKPGHQDDLASLGELAATRTHRTRRGGKHLIYLDPDGLCRSGKLGPGGTIDVKAGPGAYIILPSPGSRYEVADGRDTAAVPGVVRELLRRSPVNAGTAAELPTPVRPGRMAGYLARMLAEPAGADRSGQLHALVCAAIERGMSDGNLAWLGLNFPPALSKYGERTVAEVMRIAGQVRPLHGHLGKPCSSVGCANAPAWMR